MPGMERNKRRVMIEAGLWAVHPPIMTRNGLDGGVLRGHNGECSVRSGLHAAFFFLRSYTSIRTGESK